MSGCESRQAVNTVERKEQVDKLRHSTQELINHCFLSNQELEWKTLFKFINETCIFRPETFVPTHSCDETSTSQHALIMWIVSCFLRVFAIPDNTTVHLEAQNCLLNLLRLVESRNHHLFCYCLREISELSSVLMGLQKHHNEQHLRFPAYLLHFQQHITQIGRKVDQEVTDSAIVLPSLSHMQTLLVETLKLLQKFPDEIVQFCAPVFPSLLKVICNGLEDGSSVTKEVCLKILIAFVEREVNIDQTVLDHIVWSVLALLGFLSDPSLDAVKLEASVATFLRIIYLNEHTVVVLRFWRAMLDILFNFISKGGYCHCSSVLQDCVGKILSKCCRLRIVECSVIGKSLFCCLGYSDCLQPLVEFFYRLLKENVNKSKEDINEKKGHVSAQSNDSLITCVEVIKNRFQKKQKIKEPRMCGRESTFHLSNVFLQKMIACQQSIIAVCQGNCAQHSLCQEIFFGLEGIRTWLEVCARLCAIDGANVSKWLLHFRVNSVWESAIFHVCGNTELRNHYTICKVLSTIMKSVGALLVISGFCTISSVMLNQCYWLLELPWSFIKDRHVVTGSSLSTAQIQEIIHSLYILSEPELASVKVFSLEAYSAVPQCSSANIRKLHVFTTALKESNDISVLHAILKLFAIVLATTDRSEVQCLIDTLRDKIGNSELQIALSQQLLPIILAASATSPQCEFNSNNFAVPFHTTSMVSIPSCNENKGAACITISTTMLSQVLKFLTNDGNLHIIPGMLQSLASLVSFIDDTSVIDENCLPLILHHNPLVLCAVRKHIKIFFKCTMSTEQVTHPAISHLLEAFKIGVMKRNQRLQEFAITTMGEIGKFVRGRYLETCIISLLKFSQHPSTCTGAIVRVQIQRIAKAHGLCVSKLLSLHKEPVCNFIVLEMLCKEKQPSSKLNTDHKHWIFKETSSIFEKKSLKQFLEVINDTLIPALVCYATPEAVAVLEFVASKCDTKVRTLLIDNFKFIFLHLVKKGQQVDLHTASEFLKSVGGFDMTAVLHTEARNVLNLLLLHLSTHKKRVLGGVKIVAGIKRSVSIESEQNIADYLHPRLHGVIAYFNFVLLRANPVEGNVKTKLAINSLMELMKLMGPKYITLVKMKVIGMLRHCLSFNDNAITQSTLSAWECFIQSVELESLGPLLGQITVALSSLVDDYSQQVSSIFEFLIVTNKDVLLPYFNEIYLMPEHPSLKNVNEIWQASKDVEKSLPEKFYHILKGVCHERSDVKRDALKALYKLQKESRSELERCKIGSETIDPVITEIITTLLRSLRGADIELRVLYGKCLGELGALDPGKLDIPAVSPVKIVKFYEIDQSFGMELLQELARAYSASSNTRTQDCCAFAIQEVLRLCDCSNSDVSSNGAKLWSSLSTECQEVLQPHLDSNYSAVIPRPTQCLPVFKNMQTKNFAQWIQKWCTWLIHKLEDDFPKRLFLPCTLIFQHDISPVVHLLPYVLLCVLRHVNSDLTKQLHGEVMAVLNHIAHSKEALPEDMYSTSMCTQTVFSALDFLTAWVIAKSKAAVCRKNKGISLKGNVEDIERVKAFTDSIPKDILALAAFKCQAYTRALMYLEVFLGTNSLVLEDHLGFLQKVYVALNEPDGVAGVATVRNSEPSIHDEIIEFESTGNYRGAAALYEQIIQEDPDEISHHEGLLRCLMRQGKFTSAVMHVDGLREKKPHWVQRLNAFRVEAAWKLGQWGDLDQYLKAESNSSKNWDVNMGWLLLASKQKNLSAFKQRLNKTRAEQMGPLSTASFEQGSYQRGYEYIVRLHMLQELEEYIISLNNNRKHNMNSWKARFSLTQETFRTQEPIMSLRRVILGLEPCKYGTEIGQYWLKSTQIARSAGHIQTSESFLLKAREYSLPEFNIEKAKHMRSEGATHAALINLQKFVRKQWPDDIALVEEEETSIHAQALLLIGRWMEDTAHYDTQTVLKQYKSVIGVDPKSEDGHFYLGKYYDRLMGFMARDRPAKLAEFLQFIIRHYGHALEYGCKYLYQCMPRLLTLWLDFGCKIADSGRRSQEKSGLKTIQQLNDIIESMMDRLPPYQYLIAFPQLISRICHPNSDVFSKLEVIILKLLKHYPQQCLWMMTAVNKSTHPDRQDRCRSILDKAKLQLPGMDKLVDDMVKLTDKLLEVCNKPAEPSKSYSMDKICRGLIRLTNSHEFSCIMVPLQSSLTVTLPAGSGSNIGYNAFPGSQPTIERFEDKVEVLASLQKPKKITVCATDGKSYILLCKPKDDLRKDARLMEFNTVINKCLRKHPDCRQRRLHIRTYAVIPLNEECGLLEWVPNTCGLRHILLKLYQEKETGLNGRETRDIVKPAGRDPQKLKDVFVNKLLPKHPPMLGEWFLRTFPDPTAWYSSRLSYAHTAAVVSMVGYVLGLGDRHGENVLFDSTNGDCVHVDFNCLFNRGETFEVAEVVPFRLTHNMIHALGATGYEGVFRKSCEITMKLMRTECDTLLCVLKTFIHDPLVEWEKEKGKQKSAEATNEKAVKIVRDIEVRLQGNYPKSKGLPLSIEGQVDDLIKAATSIDNLSKMYIGWAAFM